MPRLAGCVGREPTAIQLAILDFVAEYTQRRGYPPTYQEIGGAVNLRSGSAVSYQVDALDKMGYLSRQPGSPRSIVVTTRHRPSPSPAAAGEPGDDSTRVPLVGRIAAGGPILAFQDIEDELLLPRSLVGHGDLIALRIRGDSMTGAGIHSGDIVVVRRQPRVEIGENVAAMIRDEVTGDLEATVKQYQVYDGHVWLIPRNPAYAPIPGDGAIIIGKVAAVFRGGL